MGARGNLYIPVGVRIGGGHVGEGDERLMSKSKSALAVKPIDPVDWTGGRVQRVEHHPATKIFAQGDPATSVMRIGS